MNLYISIARRRSCRKYEPQPLTPAFLRKIESVIKEFESLFPDCPVELRFTDKVKGLFHVEAPHYLIIGGQGTPGEQENAGFLFEQLALWFDAMEIGCVWLGASKDAGPGGRATDMIAMAFGKPAESVHRTKEQFKRKPIDQITNAPQNVCIQAAHLAPSGMNTQPWYFEQQAQKFLVYKQKLRPPVSLIYKHSDIDMGIALCHYALACKETGAAFRFSRRDSLPDKAGYLPFGVIE